jgi:hypothetical protein
VKLTLLRAPENLGLNTALSQTTSPPGTDWLLKCVEKHTFLAQGVGVVILEVTVLAGGVVEAVVVVGGRVVTGRDEVVTKQEHADEILVEALVH